MSNVVYWRQYLTIFYILDLQETIYIQVPEIDYPSAGRDGVLWSVGLCNPSVKSTKSDFVASLVDVCSIWSTFYPYPLQLK